jgi:hypothetical protein
MVVLAFVKLSWLGSKKKATVMMGLHGRLTPDSRRDRCRAFRRGRRCRLRSPPLHRQCRCHARIRRRPRRSRQDRPHSRRRLKGQTHRFRPLIQYDPPSPTRQEPAPGCVGSRLRYPPAPLLQGDRDDFGSGRQPHRRTPGARARGRVDVERPDPVEPVLVAAIDHVSDQGERKELALMGVT